MIRPQTQTTERDHLADHLERVADMLAITHQSAADRERVVRPLFRAAHLMRTASADLINQHFELASIAAQMHHEGATSEEIAYAMEKPHKHQDVLDRFAASLADDDGSDGTPSERIVEAVRQLRVEKAGEQ